MTAVMLVGALVGVGVLLLVLQFDTGRASGASELARLDAARARTRRTATLTEDDGEERESLRVRQIGSQVRAVLEARGWNLPAGLRADLAVMGGTVEGHLGMSVLAAVAGLQLSYYFEVATSPTIVLVACGLFAAALVVRAVRERARLRVEARAT